MTRVLVANYCDLPSFDAENDDPTRAYELGLDGMAAPQLASVCAAQEPPPWWLDMLKQTVEDEYREVFEGDEEGLLDFARTRREWLTEGWVESPDRAKHGTGRPHQVLWWVEVGAPEGQMADACIVIHALDVDERKED